MPVDHKQQTGVQHRTGASSISADSSCITPAASFSHTSTSAEPRTAKYWSLAFAPLLPALATSARSIHERKRRSLSRSQDCSSYSDLSDSDSDSGTLRLYTVLGKSQRQMDVIKTYISPTRQGGPAAPRGKAAHLQKQHIELYGIKRLVTIFATWKLLLIVIACASPGDGYDTSTQIFLDQHRDSGKESWSAKAIEHLVLRLTRWDGIYFASASLHGKVYEQEWAFSWVLSRVTSTIARVFLSPLPLSQLVKHALAGTVISHVSHFLAVITLYHLTYELIPATDVRKRAIAFTASTLHVFSPAGLFLSAPYGESTFAFFNFAGMLSYSIGTKFYASFAIQRRRGAGRWLLLAGLFYAAAATIRSNGLLSGMPFAWDAAITLMPIQKVWRQRDSTRRKKIAMILVAGSCVAVGFALPQIVAYKEYCINGNTRPWCSHLPPSIYNWVQSHYWGVGFLRYWTLNNVPLFLLAAPMLAFLLSTGHLALFRANDLATLAISGEGKKPDDSEDIKFFTSVVPRLALPQLVLVLLAATSFHVQIINRISSGYSAWYIVLAIAIHAEPGERARLLGTVLSDGAVKWIVRGMIMYAIVQGGLFACFLPPA